MSWDEIRGELGNRFLAGPLISPSRSSGAFSKGLRFSGFSIQAATDELKLDANILEYSTFWSWRPLSNYVLLAEEVPFSFFRKTHDPIFIDSVQVVTLLDAVDEIYTHSQTLPDILELLSDLQPLLPPRHSGMAPLKGQSFGLLKPELADQGFAVAALRRHQRGVTIRIVWAFPNARLRKPVLHYVHAVSIEFTADSDGNPKKANVLPPHYNCITRHITKRFLKVLKCPLEEVLSETGRQALLDAFMRRKHPRTIKADAMLKFARNHPALHACPRKLAEAFITAGFYSPKTSKTQIVWTCESLIRKIKTLSA
jgi:hypothetical protein